MDFASKIACVVVSLVGGGLVYVGLSKKKWAGNVRERVFDNIPLSKETVGGSLFRMIMNTKADREKLGGILIVGFGAMLMLTVATGVILLLLGIKP